MSQTSFKQLFSAQASIDLFYILNSLIEIESDQEIITSLLTWFGVIIDLIILNYMKKVINTASFNLIKDDVLNAIEVLRNKIQISKNMSLILSSIQCIDSKFVKYIKSQGLDRDDLIIENLVI